MTGTPLGLAIVTGGAGDIGQAIARRLAATHAGVLLVDRDGAGAEAAAAAIGCRAAACDVTDPAALAALAAEAARRGPVSTLVNNAGAARAAEPRRHHARGLGRRPRPQPRRRLVRLRGLPPGAPRRRGSVVNVASVNGLGVFGHPAYSAAKAGMIHLTRLIAVEYGRHGIRANAVAPGTVATRAWEARRAANPRVMEEAAAHYPLGRVATPDDIAAAVAFLAGPDAAAITGVCLPVDCGLTAGTPALARTFSQSPDYDA